MLIALISVIWLIYDSNRRRLPVTGWRMAIILVACLTIPAMLYRFTVTSPSDIHAPLAPFSEPIFYLGLLGGVLPPIIAVGYYVTYLGLEGCAQGHIFDTALGECPECARLAPPPPMPAAPRVDYSPPPPQMNQPPPPAPKPKAQAWLVSSDGRSYQLNLGETTIGRSSQNDIQLSGDTTVGRMHAKVIEQNHHFKIYDLGSTNHTRVNQHVVRQPILLEHNDELQLGDNTRLRFITAQ
jgi:hypothetical protein